MIEIIRRTPAKTRYTLQLVLVAFAALAFEFAYLSYLNWCFTDDRCLNKMIERHHLPGHQ